jgi:uncharacterized protein YacL
MEVSLLLLLFIAVVTSYQLFLFLRTNTVRVTKQRPIFVDTSVLIDGRIIAVAQSGFISSPLYIPRSVIGELQLLADGGDTEKRARARHGLDVVKQLQAIETVTVVIHPDGESAPEGVDNRLLALAKRFNGAVCTIDYNLNKVAQVEKVLVLNVNDLAMSLRMAYLPGEKLLLELTQKGNDAHQAIGHLTDGTMVVVEHASQYVGKTMEIEFIRSLQTAAGKMMFARIVKRPDQQPKKKPQEKGRKPQPSKESPVEVKQKLKPEEPKQKIAQSTSRPQQQKRRRPQTNEDRLVELANSQE